MSTQWSCSRECLQFCGIATQSVILSTSACHDILHTQASHGGIGVQQLTGVRSLDISSFSTLPSGSNDFVICRLSSFGLSQFLRLLCYIHGFVRSRSILFVLFPSSSSFLAFPGFGVMLHLDVDIAA
jgi:hypothetical protein